MKYNKHVAIGIIRNESGQYLVQQRSKDCIYFPLKWEFPGGKINIDEGEDSATALCREIFEEVGLEVQPSDIKLIYTRDYACFEELWKLYFYEVLKYKGEVSPRLNQKILWMFRHNIEEIDFLKVNLTAIDHIF